MRTLFLISLPLLLTALALPAKAFDDDLLLYLSFGENGLADGTGKTNDAVIKGGVEFVEGKFGDGVELDGTSGYQEIELTPELIAIEAGSFAAELWVKTEQVPTTNYGIFGGYGPAGHFDGHWTLFLSETDLVQFAVFGGGYVQIDVEQPTINDGVWHHIAGVRDKDAGVVSIYIDGELVGEKDDSTTNLNQGRESIWIGNHLSRFWAATFDEARVWSRALDDAEILRAMDGTILAVDPLEKLATTWGSIR